MKLYKNVFEFLADMGIEVPKEKQIYISALAQIGAQLMAYRKKHNLTQTALAKKIGVSQTMISAIERGDKNVSVKVLAKIVAKLGGDLRINLGILPQKEAEKNEWAGISFKNFGNIEGVKTLAEGDAA